MFHYLYYKLYQATLKGSLYDIAMFASSVYFGGLIATNILVLIFFLGKLNLIPILFYSKHHAGLLSLLCIIFSYLYFIYKKRYITICNKYIVEDNKTRIKGNVLVSIYVGVTFLSIFAVAFFKTDK